MTYKTTIEEREGYIFARMEGPESHEAAVRFWHDLAEAAEKSGRDRFLVVDDVDGTLSISEHYDISLVVARLFASRRIAYVDAKEETYAKNKFGETVVVNRGVNAEVFRLEDEALDWLLGGGKGMGDSG